MNPEPKTPNTVQRRLPPWMAPFLPLLDSGGREEIEALLNMEGPLDPQDPRHVRRHRAWVQCQLLRRLRAAERLLLNGDPLPAMQGGAWDDPEPETQPARKS